jgi:hypothetical protein
MASRDAVAMAPSWQSCYMIKSGYMPPRAAAERSLVQLVPPTELMQGVCTAAAGVAMCGQQAVMCVLYGCGCVTTLGEHDAGHVVHQSQ